MSFHLIACLMGLSFACDNELVGPKVNSQTNSLERQIDALLKEPVEKRTFLGAVLVAKDGKPIYRKAFGTKDKANGQPNQPEDGFMLFSVTKQFTAALILRLQEQKMLSVHDPVSKFLANWPTEWDKVTIHHLLTHSAGIEIDMLYLWLVKYHPQFWPNVKELPPEYKPVKLLDGPGRTFRYSNAGYTILSLIAEKAGKKSFDLLMKAEVFDRAGMNHTGRETTSPHPTRVRGHQLENGKLVYLEQQTIDIIGAGEIVSTVDDMLSWDNALEQHSVLSETSRKQMFTPHLKGKNAGFAYGWRIESAKTGQPKILFGGSGSGFSSYTFKRPDLQLYVVVLCNLDAQELAPNPRKISELAEIQFEKPATK